jgi:hypothetical protein
LANQFTTSAGIDPDLCIGSEKQASGMAVPSAFVKFSTATVDSYVVAWITSPKVSNRIYAVLANGKLVQYHGDFTSETLLGTFAGSNSGGACYYNNYIYCFGTGNNLAYDSQNGSPLQAGDTLTGSTSGATAKIVSNSGIAVTGTLVISGISGTFVAGETITDGHGNTAHVHSAVTGKTDVSRFGPLDQGSPYFQNAWWTGQGLAQLSDTTYPVIRNISLPNHWGLWHGPTNSVYFCDFLNGQGIIHRLSTMKGAYEGELNSTVVPSAYQALTLPYGFYPTSIGPYGTSVAVAAMQSIDSTFGLNQGNAALFAWNPTDERGFDQQFDLPDPIVTAMTSRNGKLTVFSGSLPRGVRASYYIGGSTFTEIAYIEDGTPPLAGAVDCQGERLYFGSFCLEPVESASVWALGSRTGTRANDVQNVAVVGSQTASTNQIVTALKYVGQQIGNESNNQIVISSSTDSAKELYRRTTAWNGSFASAWETPIVNMGSNFRIDRIRIQLGSAVASGTAIQCTVIYDDGVSASSALTINNTDQNGATRITFKTPQITGQGQNNFRLKFEYVNATGPTPINFPIEVWAEVFDDEPLKG